MSKDKTRAEGEPLRPPGRWGHEATVNFYNRHGGSVQQMAEAIEAEPRFGVDAYAFAAKIADYVEKTTEWRRDRCFPMKDNERTGSKINV